MAKQVKCDVLEVQGLIDGVRVMQLEVPAYTLTWPTFHKRLQMAVSRYEIRSDFAGTKPSMADFALYLLRMAQDDPREQDADA